MENVIFMCAVLRSLLFNIYIYKYIYIYIYICDIFFEMPISNDFAFAVYVDHNTLYTCSSNIENVLVEKIIH